MIPGVTKPATPEPASLSVENAFTTIVPALVPSRLWQVLRRNIIRKTRGNADAGLQQYYEAMQRIIVLARVYLNNPSELMDILAVPKTQPDRYVIDSPLNTTNEALSQKYGVALAAIRNQFNEIYKAAMTKPLPSLDQLRRLVRPQVDSRPIALPSRPIPLPSSPVASAAAPIPAPTNLQPIPPVTSGPVPLLSTPIPGPPSPPPTSRVASPPASPVVPRPPPVVPSGSRVAPPASVGVQESLNSDCLENAGWENTGFFVQEFQDLLDSQVDGDRLSTETARLAFQYLEDMYWDGSSPLWENIPQRSLSRYDTTELTLKDTIGQGATGLVFSADLRQDGTGTRNVLVKMINPQVSDAEYRREMVNEILVQSILWCTCNELKVSPNPIPAILAPLELHMNPVSSDLRNNPGMKDQRNGTPAVAMNYAGKTLASLLMELPGLPEGETSFWLILVSLAEKLQALQQAVNFVHTDLHTGNVLVQPSAPQDIILGGVTYALPYKVSMIDFGRSCLDVGNKTLVTAPENSDFCVRTGAYDLMLLLSVISTQSTWMPIRLPLMELCKSAFTQQGKTPPLWVFNAWEQPYFQSVWRTTTVTTPAKVISFCQAQLQKLQKGKVSPRVRVQSQAQDWTWLEKATEERVRQLRQDRERKLAAQLEREEKKRRLLQQQLESEEAQRQEQLREQQRLEDEQREMQRLEREANEERRLEEEEMEREAARQQEQRRLLEEDFDRYLEDLDRQVREREAQMAREREAQLAREREARLAREREAQLASERRAQMASEMRRRAKEDREAAEWEYMRQQFKKQAEEADRQERRQQQRRRDERPQQQQQRPQPEQQRPRPERPQRRQKERPQPASVKPKPKQPQNTKLERLLTKIKSDIDARCGKLLDRFQVKDYKQLVRLLHTDRTTASDVVKREFLAKYYGMEADDSILQDKGVDAQLLELTKKAIECFKLN